MTVAVPIAETLATRYFQHTILEKCADHSILQVVALNLLQAAASKQMTTFWTLSIHSFETPHTLMLVCAHRATHNRPC